MNKQILIFFVAVAILVGCQKSPEKRVQGLIKNYIYEHANDPDSYEPVEFGSLDTNYKTRYDLEGTLKLNEMAEKREMSMEEFARLSDSINKIRHKEPDGFIMTHRYRAKNALGAKILKTEVFVIDEDLMEVLYSDDLEDIR